ncbi:MAG: DNA polymerase III subunit delta [Bryobacteraceae bacterium]
MSPDQFLRQIGQRLAPAYLFLGPEPYERDRCRRALIERVLPDEAARESGFSRHDLDEAPLTEALDDARSLSLFAADRVIWVSSAESALPRGRAADSEDLPGVEALASFLRQPMSGVVVVFDASRYEFEGDDKTKIERVRKFYSAIPDQVEFRPFSPESARRLTQDLARETGLQLGSAELAMLLDATGGAAGRIRAEIEKLSLYVGSARKVTAEDIGLLVPNAQVSTIFALIAALERNNRQRALESLDNLVRQGEYLPLALTFLATQFRLALAAKEAGLRSSQQVQAHFTRQGIRIWRDRAEQVSQTASAFSQERLQSALKQIFEADRALRDTRPGDRIVMEKLVLSLTD